MEIAEAADRVLLGESLADVATAYRAGLCADFGLDISEVAPTTFVTETGRFMNKLCRHLGDRHAGDPRVAAALVDWVAEVDEYDAWDSLMSGFEFDEREALLRRGRHLFPGALTAHWLE